MGKKSKTKHKNKSSSTSSDVQKAVSKKSTGAPAARHVPPPEKINISEVLSKLNKEELLKEFDSLLEGNPEEGIQAARDLFIHVRKKRISNEKKLKLLEEKKKSYQAKVKECRGLILDESEEYSTARSQIDKLELLKEKLLEKKEILIEEGKAKVKEERDKQRQRTEELIAEARDVSDKLEKINETRQRYAEENEQLRVKLKAVLDAYTKQEEEFNSEVEKFDQQISAIKEESDEKHVETDENKQSYEELEKEFLEGLSIQESLKEQLAESARRFEGFQVSIAESNDAFEKFKTQMDEKAKIIMSLEKENAALKKKKEETEEVIDTMMKEIAMSSETELKVAEKQTEKLSSLCSALKTEITKLEEELK